MAQGTGKHVQLLARCGKLAPVPTLIACALAGAVEAVDLGLTVPILVGPSEKINSTAKAPGIRKIGIGTGSDGKTEEQRFRKGEMLYMPAASHLPENLSDQPFEVILVEQTMVRRATKTHTGPDRLRIECAADESRAFPSLLHENAHLSYCE